MAKHVIRPIPMIKGTGTTLKMAYQVAINDDVAGGPRAIYTWFIEGPKEKIIVDTGAIVEKFPVQARYRGIKDVTVEQVQTLEEGLGKLGLKPEDIDVVILTHMHEDHVMLARSYPNAKFIVQKAELEYARNPHPVQQFTYLKDKFEDVNFEVIEGDKEIVEGVSVMLMTGHSAGGQNVIVDTTKGKVAIAGFCGIDLNFYPPPEFGTPVIPPGIHLDVTQCYEDMMKLKGLADIIVTLHGGKHLETDRIP